MHLAPGLCEAQPVSPSLELNEATMKVAVAEYLDRRIKPGVSVEVVSVKSNHANGCCPTFTVTLRDSEAQASDK